MQINRERIEGAVATAYQQLFGGRIARTTFAIRIAVLIAIVVILIAPFNTILAPSSKTLRDAYFALSLCVIALCLIGIVSAYVKRLHDMGLRGYWALASLILLPMVITGLGSLYIDHRYESDPSYNTAELVDLIGYMALTAPFLVAMWRGEKGENRFGPVPDPVEHVGASKFSIAAVIGAAAILIPTSIYAGLFQSGVWVGRGDMAPSMPMIDSNSSGRLLAKCWNIKGVGAGTGEGPLGGVYRDGYSGSVLDFVVSDDGAIDIVPAGDTFSKAYRADGFQIHSYGLDATDGYISVGERDRFMIAAVYDGSQTPDGNMNFTTFSFAKTGEIWPEWQMVMSTGMSLGSGGFNLTLGQSEQARGRLMIGDCVLR